MLLQKRRMGIKKDEFYSLLDKTLKEIPVGGIRIILRNFYPKIGCENSFKLIIGDYSLHHEANHNGPRLINVATGIKLRIKFINPRF